MTKHYLNLALLIFSKVRTNASSNKRAAGLALQANASAARQPVGRTAGYRQARTHRRNPLDSRQWRAVVVEDPLASSDEEPDPPVGQIERIRGIVRDVGALPE